MCGSPEDRVLGFNTAAGLYRAADSRAYSADQSCQDEEQVLTTESTQQSGGFGWLITDFVRQVPGVAHAVVVSADGLLIARSQGMPPDRAEQLSAVTSGLVSLGHGAARVFDAGEVTNTVVEMDRGYLFLRSMSNGSSLAVLATPKCDIGVVAYEMTLLAERVGRQLAPEPRAAPADAHERPL